MKRSIQVIAAALALSVASGTFAADKPHVIRVAGQDDPETIGTMCTGEDWVVYNAKSLEGGKTVSVCMSEGDDSTPSHLTYRYGTPGDAEMIYPAVDEGSAKKFTLRRYTRAQVTYLKFEFTTEGHNYEILNGHEGPDEYSELRVVRLSDGKIVAEHVLSPTTSLLSLMDLEGIVRDAPFDE